MKYWKFKSGRFFQFLLFTDDRKLLFGTFKERSVDNFISSIDELKEVPKTLKGIALNHIESVEVGKYNRIINITLNSGSQESIKFNNTEERDLIFGELKVQLDKFQQIELDFTKHYKKQFIYDCLRICIFLAVIWFISDSIINNIGLVGITIYSAILGGLIKILLILTGKLGIIGLALLLMFFQFFKLRQHLKKDFLTIKLRRR